MADFCHPCERAGTWNPAVSGNMCEVHKWQWEMCRLSPTYFQSWAKRERRLRGVVPMVLQPDFRLKRCPFCSGFIKPWQRRAHGTRDRGGWCTPSDYRRARFCHKKRCREVGIAQRRAARGAA